MPRYSLQSIKDLTSTDILGMNIQTLRSVYRQARGYAIQRSNAYQKAVSEYKSRYQKTGRFEFGYDSYIDPLTNRVNLDVDISKAKRSELLHGIIEYRNYLRLKQSTVSGTAEVQKDVISTVEKYSGYTIPKSDYEEFWQAYKDLRKEYSAVSGGKYELWRRIGEVAEQHGGYDDFREKFINKYFPENPPLDSEEEYDDDSFTIEDFND